jgi:hypothetical protein
VPFKCNLRQPLHRGRETFYYEAEHRRLTWLKSSLVGAGWTPKGESNEESGLDGFLNAGGFGHGGGGGATRRGGGGGGGTIAGLLAGRGWGGESGGGGGAGNLALLPPPLRAAERQLTRERAALRRLARRLEKPQLEAIFAEWGIGGDPIQVQFSKHIA